LRLLVDILVYVLLVERVIPVKQSGIDYAYFLVFLYTLFDEKFVLAVLSENLTMKEMVEIIGDVETWQCLCSADLFG